MATALCGLGFSSAESSLFLGEDQDSIGFDTEGSVDRGGLDEFWGLKSEKKL